MDFGSSHVYWYDVPEYEVISDVEFDEGMVLSDDSRSGSDSDTDDSTEYYKSKKHNWRKVKSGNLYDNQAQATSGLTVRQADTNIVSVDFTQLVAPGHMFTGDPVYCTDCKALLSHISKISKVGNQQVWKCEFCETSNNINVLDGEIPKEADIAFMLEPAPSIDSANRSSEGDNSLVVFCVDVSSSMATTMAVPGKMEWVDTLPKNRGWNSTGYSSSRDITYISRLMGVQAAVLHQLDPMIKDHPNRRVALITFSDEVTVLEVGQDRPRIIHGNKLSNQKKLVGIGKELKLPKAIKDTGKELKEKVLSLHTDGCTALGPALLISVTMAGKCPGSKVILCTDGMANEGVGQVNSHNSDGERFYHEVGAEAAKNGTSISVISFKGTDCKMVHLGKMADQTEGQVNIVDPQKLTEEFSSILAGQFIATNAEATIILHKQLYIRNEEKKESKIEKHIGNVTDATVLTFEYGIRSAQKKDTNQAAVETDNYQQENKMEVQTSETRTEVPEELPFQMQVKYTNKDRATVLRVFTQFKPATKDRREAEKNTNIDVIGANAKKQVASKVLDGSYTDGRVKALTSQRLVWRHKKIEKNKNVRKEKKKQYKKTFKSVLKLEHRIKHEQKKEMERIGRNLSESEGSDDDSDTNMRSRRRSRSRERRSRSREKLQKKKQMRQNAMSDGFSQAVYRSRKCRSLSRSLSRSRSRSPPRRRRSFSRSWSRSSSGSRSRSGSRGRSSSGSRSRSRSRGRSYKRRSLSSRIFKLFACIPQDKKLRHRSSSYSPTSITYSDTDCSVSSSHSIQK